MPLTDDDAKFVTDNYGAGASWVALGTYKGKDGASSFYAFPYKADLKASSGTCRRTSRMRAMKFRRPWKN